MDLGTNLHRVRLFIKGIILLTIQCLLSMGLVAYGQNCHLVLKIQLIDIENNQNIPGAHLLLDGKIHAIDNNGTYIFKQICPGASSVSISHVSYEKNNLSVRLFQDTSMRVFLKRTANLLDEVTVSANATDANSRNSTTINKQQRAESQGKNLAEVLGDVAGVNILKTGANNGKPIINGLYGNRLVLLNQGVRHESQQWGTDHAPEIDPFSGENITVIKSADAVRYGPDALGGIIKISAAPFAPHRKALSSNSIVFDSNGNGMVVNSKLEGTVGKFAYRAGITAKKHGNLKSAMYYLGNTGSNETNGNVSASYKMGKNTVNMYLSHFGHTLGVFQGAHIGSKEDILARIAHGEPFEEYNFSYAIGAPKQHVTHQLGKLEYQYQHDENTLIEAQYSVQRNHRMEYDLRRVAENEVPMADIALTTQQLEIVYTHPRFMVGASGQIQINNNVPGTGSTPIIPNFENHGFGSFFSAKIPWKNILFETGIRYDYKFFDAAGYQYDYGKINSDGSIPQFLMKDHKHFHNISGVAGLSHRINPVLTWKSNLGLAWRAPSANELYSDGIHHGTGTYEVGNRNLKSERGLKWINSLLIQKGPVKGGIDLFAQVIDNYIYSQPVPDSTRQTIRGTFPLFQYMQDRAFFYGLDMSMIMDVNPKWQYGFSLSIVKAKNITEDSFLPNIPAPKFQHFLTYHFSTDKVPAYIKIKHLFQTKQDRYEEHTDYSPPPPSFHLFDAILASSLKLKKERTMEFQVVTENIFNKAYKDYMDRFRYYAHALGRNISIKVNLTF